MKVTAGGDRLAPRDAGGSAAARQVAARAGICAFQRRHGERQASALVVPRVCSAFCRALPVPTPAGAVQLWPGRRRGMVPAEGLLVPSWIPGLLLTASNSSFSLPPYRPVE